MKDNTIVTGPEPTTKKEIWAWWLYMAAIEPISVAVLQLFLPAILESLSLIVGYVPNSNPRIPCTKENADQGCIIFEMGSKGISATTFSYAVIALAVALQAVIFVLFGALGDYGRMRKTFLAIFTGLGGILCVAVLGIHGSWSAWIAGTLDILITIAFGVSLMLYNSYLPLLAEAHPDYTTFSSDDPLDKAKKRESISSSLSSKSFMLGYASAVVFLCLCVLFLFLRGSITPKAAFLDCQIAVAACGVVWGLGAIYPLLNLKSRRGAALPPSANLFTFSVKKTMRTIRKFHQLPHLFWFLAAFFLYADGCNTIGTVSVLFARSELDAPANLLILCSILATFCGICGTFLFFRIQRSYHFTSKTMLITILSGFIILTGYGGMGAFNSKFGLRHKYELLPVAGFYGFLMGAMQSFSRVIYGEMIPPGSESEFFSLYAITDKGSSWIGPLIQAAVSSMLPDQRLGLLFLGLMILIPFPVLIWLVDTKEGKEDALSYRQKHTLKEDATLTDDESTQQQK